MSSRSTRSLPEKPSLAQLKKQAKELLKAYRTGDPKAVAEVARFERQPDAETFALTDAQRILARAYGFPSWTQLKQHVEGVNAEAFCIAVEASDLATVRRLAKARPELVNAERPSSRGEHIPLHYAVFQRNADMTRVLMQLGAHAHSGIWPHRDATTAYVIAKERGYDDIVAVMEEEETRLRKERSAPGATISSKTDEIIKAIFEDRCDEAKQMLQSDLSLVGACNTGGKAPLHIAAWRHNPEMVAWLLDHGAPVNAVAPFAVEPPLPPATAMDYAALVAGWSAHGRHFTYMENHDKPPEALHETIRVLRAGGAELTPRGAVAISDTKAILQMHREGRLKNDIHILRGGLISIAVRVNRIDMVSLLLDLGLDVNEAIDSVGSSWGMPLWFASLCGRGEIAELLLKRGADVNAIVFASGDPHGNAQITKDKDMQALLRRYEARITVEGVDDHETAKAILDGKIKAHSLNVTDPTLTDLAEQMLWANASSDPEVVRMCLPHMKRKGDDPWWNYVLVHTTLPETVKLLLAHGVDPDVTSGGYTILHHLASAYVGDENRVAVAALLLDAGASLTKRDPLLKSTPLGWACRWGRIELVRLYLDRGVDVWERDAEPWATPLAWATKGGHGDILELLRVR